MIKLYALALIFAILPATIIFANETHTIGCDLHNNSVDKKEYYIGEYKKPDGTILVNCYIQILHSDDGMTVGTDIVCPAIK